jgi:hypothetical protein
MTDTIPLPAGRELDARIARDVMGWTDQEGFWMERTPDGLRYRVAENWDEFQPSTDIRAAWNVVERMRPRFPDASLAVRLGAGDTGNWFCEFGIDYGWATHGEGDEVVAVGEADTAPLAICYAALAAIMEA